MVTKEFSKRSQLGRPAQENWTDVNPWVYGNSSSKFDGNNTLQTKTLGMSHYEYQTVESSSMMELKDTKKAEVCVSGLWVTDSHIQE